MKLEKGFGCSLWRLQIVWVFLSGELSSLEAFWITYNVFHFVLLKNFSFSWCRAEKSPRAPPHHPPGEHCNSLLCKVASWEFTFFEYSYLIKGMAVSLILIGSSTFDPTVSI